MSALEMALFRAREVAGEDDNDASRLDTARRSRSRRNVEAFVTMVCFKKRSATSMDKLDLALRKKPATAGPRHCVECVEAKGMERATSGELLECTDCSYATHPQCGGYSADIVEMQKWSYRCMQCKKCKMCYAGKLGQDKDLVICPGCDDAYHLSCLTPPPATVADWICRRCFIRRAGKKLMAEYGVTDLDALAEKMNGPKSRKSTKSAVPPTGHPGPYTMDVNVDEIKPDWDAFNGFPVRPSKEAVEVFGGEVDTSKVVSRAVEALHQSLPPPSSKALKNSFMSWSVNDVAHRFDEKGSKQFADIIRKEFIDGEALTLLTREDVMTRFGLPLVQALRMYRDICAMCPFGPHR